MCAYFETRFSKKFFQDKRIIDLGSGVGILYLFLILT